MKRAVTIILLLAAICSILLLSFLRIWLAQENQNSWEAVRNYIFRDGQIAVTLTPGTIISDVKCAKSSDVTWKGNRAIVKAGYIWAPNIVIVCIRPQGETRRITVDTEKLNWDRVSIIEEAPGRFANYANGIRRDNSLLTVEE